MESLFSPQTQYLWMIVLAAALFFPVRQLIWVFTVRRFEARQGKSDEATRLSLKRRAGFTAALLSLIFSFVYVTQLFLAR